MKVRWLPDWRCKEEYPDPEQISKRELAWEFLRRNPQYQEDFYNWKVLGDDGYIEKFLSDKPTCMGQIIEAKYILETEERNGRKYVTGYPTASSYIASKYGIDEFCLPDPALKIEDQFLFKFSDDRMHCLEYLDGIPLSAIAGIKPSKPSQVGVLFDVKLPLETQLKKIEVLLRAKRECLESAGEIEIVNKRDRGAIYRNYLRVLDAFFHNEDLKSIAESIFPGESNAFPNYSVSKKITNYHNAATKIRDHDYRYFIHMED